MKRHIAFWVAVALVLAAVWGAGTLLAGGTAREEQQLTNDFEARVRQIAFRAQIVADDMTARIRTSSGQMAAEERQVLALANAVSRAAGDLDDMMKSTQNMIENEVTGEDNELAADVDGVRAQLDYGARSLENALQYIEHMTYRLNKVSL